MNNPWSMVKTNFDITAQHCRIKKNKRNKNFSWVLETHSSFSKWPIPTVSGRQMKFYSILVVANVWAFSLSPGNYSLLLFCRKKEREGIGWPFLLKKYIRGSPLLKIFPFFFKKIRRRTNCLNQCAYTHTQGYIVRNIHTHTHICVVFPLLCVKQVRKDIKSFF